jgi:hypothetical protein
MTNDQVNADPQRLWRSDLPAGQASIPLRLGAGDVLDHSQKLPPLT